MTPASATPATPDHITPLLRNHHQKCDQLFAAAEELAARQSWVACAATTGALTDALEAHFQGEETLLFPAFEAATGMRDGPTAMMRHEHNQIRPLLGMLHDAVAQRDTAAYADAANTLLVLLQQHNFKEENILYPMCDRNIAERPPLTSALAAMLADPTDSTDSHD